MDVTERERRLLRLNVNRIVDEVETFNQLYDEVARLDRVILDELLGSESADAVLEKESLEAEEYKGKINRAVVMITDTVGNQRHGSSKRSVSEMETVSFQVTETNYKLPKIELKKFGGDMKEWLGWWAQFEKVHLHAKLTATDKFQYLYQATIEGSKAREVMDAYPQSELNYPKVVEVLEERFGKKKVLKQMYVRDLLKLIGRTGMPISKLYYKLDSSIRALTSVGVTCDQSSDFLYPMVESCLPEDLLIVWQRHVDYYGKVGGTEDSANALKLLMAFLKVEVENEEERLLYKAGKPTEKDSMKGKYDRHDNLSRPKRTFHTAMGMMAIKVACIFCGRSNHPSASCYRTGTMSLKAKQHKVKEAKVCYACLKRGHGVKICRANIRCSRCGGNHVKFMCRERVVTPVDNKEAVETANTAGQVTTDLVAVNSSINCCEEVLLKTIMAKVKKNGKELVVRMLFDEGSQSSYVSAKVVKHLGASPVGQEHVRNVMIDGSITELTLFKKFNIEIEGLDKTNKAELTLRERPQIGGIPPRVKIEEWRSDLHRKGITILDHAGVRNNKGELDVLIGSDYREKLMTGRRIQMGETLFAVESVFGWVVCGTVDPQHISASEMCLQSYLVGDISHMWDLETIGVKDPIETISQLELDVQMKEEFQAKISRDEDGRYVVPLPWANDDVKVHLPTNYSVCQKRLVTVMKKVIENGKLSHYSKVFQDWLEEGLIVEDTGDPSQGHFLPHRRVCKDSTTTPGRPVFDASCRTGDNKSINQCLNKGMNMLELIPVLVLGFRARQIGVTSDIRKAFQMIRVLAGDQVFQKFLWELDGIGKTFRHTRVVFGLNCSPFILAAVLELHLKTVEPKDVKIAGLLLKSLYVDNCVTSFSTQEEVENFKRDSVRILADAKMELRQWETSLDSGDPSVTSVLGLKWDKRADTVFCVAPKIPETLIVTKRNVLSIIAQVFDPIGTTVPCLIGPKVMLQRAWGLQLQWDQPWPEEETGKFLKWYSTLEVLPEIRIPRYVKMNCVENEKMELHCFCDASAAAYAAVVFGLGWRQGKPQISFLNAKARVAPLSKNGKKVTIPRLELLGCLLGSRLVSFVAKALDMKEVVIFCWSDSSTALSWIRKDTPYATFISNRVKEIRGHVSTGYWKFVPGTMNPADLPSRGCTAGQLLESKWWEGPTWLLQRRFWPEHEEEANEDLVNQEVKRPVLSCGNVMVRENQYDDKLRLSSYVKIVHAAAWVRRFLGNCRLKTGERTMDKFLSKEEVVKAEIDVLKELQEAYFGNGHGVKSVVCKKMEDGLIHVETRITMSNDTMSFKYPILLPRNSTLVKLLINYVHRCHGHAGAQLVLNTLREKYWIVQGKKQVKSVIHKCVICRRQSSKPVTTDQAPLPIERVEAKFAFQTTGVDLAGPLFLKCGKKMWIALYTCAVYRGIHLDVVDSLSTGAFLNSLERFVNLIGRPSKIFSDNGTNFVGTANLLKLLDGTELERELAVKEFRWKFNTPGAPWWGGFWERLVRSVKELLRKMLGRAKWTLDELMTCLAVVTGTINDRPLTVVSEDQDDLQTLTPRMFMRDLPIGCFPESEQLGPHLGEAYQKIRHLKLALQARFRKEYLSLLIQQKCKQGRDLKVGDLVLIGSDDKRRYLWPLGKIEELVKGRDGKERLAKVKVAKKGTKKFATSVMVRPVQKLYPLEVDTAEHKDCRGIISNQKGSHENVEGNHGISKILPTTSKYGRVLKEPVRYSSYNF